MVLFVAPVFEQELKDKQKQFLWIQFQWFDSVMDYYCSPKFNIFLSAKGGQGKSHLQGAFLFQGPFLLNCPDAGISSVHSRSSCPCVCQFLCKARNPECLVHEMCISNGNLLVVFMQVLQVTQAFVVVHIFAHALT